MAKTTRSDTIKTLSSTKKLYILLFWSVFILLLISIYLFRYNSFVRSLDHYEQFSSPEDAEAIFPKLSLSQIINLGWAHSPTNTTNPYPKSSYLNFNQTKPHNTIRIGIFGGSSVYGQEVANGFDFPSLLQDKFNESGNENIQVINFGVIAYGMHQSYLLWEYLGKHYDLDYVLIHPFKFHYRRDSSFNFKYNRYGPIHARYILSHNKLQLLSTIGNSRPDANRIYNRLFPPWQYIRYDLKPPTFLRLLVPLGRQFKRNPLYHKVFSEDEDIFKTYSIIFNNLANHAKTIVLCHKKSLCQMANELLSKKIHVYRSQVRKFIIHPAIYRASLNHLSALGNEALATEIFSLMTGQERPRFKVIDLLPRVHQAKDTANQAFPLHQYKTLTVKIGNGEVANFAARKQGDAPWYFRGSFDFKKYKTTSLLWFREGKELKFLPLPYFLKDQEPVFITLKLNDRTFTLPIGYVEATSSIIGRLVLSDLDKNNLLILNNKDGGIPIRQNGLKFLKLKTSRSINYIGITLGNKSQYIFRGSPQGIFKRFVKQTLSMLGMWQTFYLKPAVIQVLHLRSYPGQYIDIDKQQETAGTMDLVVTNKYDQTLRYPILSYRIRAADTSKFDPPYSFPVQKKSTSPKSLKKRAENSLERVR